MGFTVLAHNFSFLDEIFPKRRFSDNFLTDNFLGGEHLSLFRQFDTLAKVEKLFQI